MPKVTKEIVTEHIEPPVAELVDLEATGAWQFADEESLLPQVDIVTHRPKHTVLSRIGRIAHWLRATPEYRREVHERSLDIIHDVAQAGMTAKQVLPPRSVEFSDVVERRSVTTQFALDIRRRILLLRRVQQMMGMFSLLSVSQLNLLSPLAMKNVGAPSNLPPVPPVDAIEQVASHIDGARPNDGDYIPLIVLK